MADEKQVVGGKSQTTSAAPTKPAETKTVAADNAVTTKTAESAVTNVPAVAPVADAPLINFEEAAAILATSKSRSSGGAKIRANIGYTLALDGVKKLAGTSVPEQEQVIVKILLGALTVNKPVISEPELNKLVLAAHKAGTLKTKQDAWHIFRYYRTDLVKRGALKQVEIALVA